MAVNVSTCNLFSVWLLYKSIFLLAWLSSAITLKLLAWFNWNFKYPLLKHCRYCWEKKKKFGSCANYADFAERFTYYKWILKLNYVWVEIIKYRSLQQNSRMFLNILWTFYECSNKSSEKVFVLLEYLNAIQWN